MQRSVHGVRTERQTPAFATASAPTHQTDPAMYRLASAVLLLALAACDTNAPPTLDAPVRVDGLSLTVGADDYDRGDTATLTLQNGTAASVWTGVLECPDLQQRVDGRWVDASVALGVACIEILIEVPPGESLSGRVVLDVPGGTYRFAHPSFPEDGDGRRLATGSFRVR